LQNCDNNFNNTININQKFKTTGKLRYSGTGATNDQDGAIVFIIMGSADLANDATYEGASRLFFQDV
jgi:hypothetical protein